MPYKGFSLIISRNICHHKDMSNDYRSNHNGTVVGLKLIDVTYIDLNMFPTKFTELGLFMNITAICYSRKVVGQCCERYDKCLIKNVIF